MRPMALASDVCGRDHQLDLCCSVLPTKCQTSFGLNDRRDRILIDAL